MFAQKPPKIKEAIFNFLRGVDIKNFNDIFDSVRKYTKSETPKASIRRTLNELYNKGKIQKLRYKDNTYITWDNLSPEERKKKFARYYKLVSEQYRKSISTIMYIGTNQTGNQDKNPNYNPDSNRYRGADKSPRKTPTDLKAWLFDDIENRDIDRFDVLSEFLFLKMKSSRLTLDSADGVFTQFFPVPYMAGTNKSKREDNISLDEFRTLLGRDMVMPMMNVEDYKIFKPKENKPMFWSLRGVDQ